MDPVPDPGGQKHADPDPQHWSSMTTVTDCFLAVSREVMGLINVRLNLLDDTILFLSREGFRLACLSHTGKVSAGFFIQYVGARNRVGIEKFRLKIIIFFGGGGGG
jgi:hypothetical protein